MSGGQDAPCLIDVEDSLFTEHINVVHVQLTNVHSASDVRQLDTDDVIGRLLRRATSGQRTRQNADVYLDIKTRKIFATKFHVRTTEIRGTSLGKI